MASTSESGHAMNVANFDTMVTIISEYGPKYNPARPDLKLPALRITLTDAQTALQKFKDEKAEYDAALIERDELFKPFKKFITKLMAAIKASEVSKAVMENILSVNDKIQGRRATATKTPAVASSTAPLTEAKKNSNAQQSAKRMIDHLEQLYTILAREPKYTPNEHEYSVAGLKERIADMRAKNSAVDTAFTKLQNARELRDAAIYTPGTGLVPVAASIKNYVKSVYGGQSPQIARLGKLQFKQKPKG